VRLSWVCFLSFFVFGFKLVAQFDSISKVTTYDSISNHSFKKAIIYSAIFPASGQIYNALHSPKGKRKAHWKVPLIYASLGTTLYFGISNLKQANGYRNEVEFRDANPSLIPQNFIEFDREGLISLYTQKRTTRDLFFVGTLLIYALQVVDAGVEAHFVHFDISDNLSLSWSPNIYSHGGIGLSTQFRLQSKSKKTYSSIFGV
jgi:hypothetical protein